MNFSIEFLFDGITETSLCETRFRSALTRQIVVSTRGKFPARRASGSFEWSAAVRSLALLFVICRSNPNSVLKGAPARTLDYALSKRPFWLKEMFGLDSNTTLIRRLFVRSYTEGRGRDALTIGLNPQFWSVSSIKIKLCGTLLDSPDLLTLLAEQLLKQLEQPMAAPLTLLRGGLEHELRLNIERPDILGSGGLKQYSTELRRGSLIHRLNGQSLLHSLSSYRVPDQNGRSRSALVKELDSSEPLRVQIPAAAILPAAIFAILKNSIPSLEVGFDYAAAFYLVRAILTSNVNPPPDVIVLGTVPSMHLMGNSPKHDYEFLMPAGFNSSWLIEGNEDDSTVSLFKEEPMNCWSAVETMSERALVHRSHADILQETVRDELRGRALVIAPFGWIAGRLGKRSHCFMHSQGRHLFMLFVRKHLRKDPRITTLQNLIHRVEGDLIFDTKAVKHATDAVMKERELCFHLINEGGLATL